MYFTIKAIHFSIFTGIIGHNHTIFRSPLEGKLSLEEELSGKRAKVTQFGRDSLF